MAAKTACGYSRRPFQRLHPAHRPANHREQALDAEMLDQPFLCPDDVADGDRREVDPPGTLATVVAQAQRPGAAHAAAEHVGADDEQPVGIERPARADDRLPPPRLAGDGMALGDILVAGQRVADQNGVGSPGVERAVGSISDHIAAQSHAAIERKRLREGCVSVRRVAEGRDLVHRTD